jgi:2-octaprenyl-6-methoxyphenol hydroxylase
VRFATTARTVVGAPERATIDIGADDGPPLLARLAVVADGAAIRVPGIERRVHEYGQVAVVTSVGIDHPHGGVAYERFTPDGPVALLPEQDHYGVVWTQTPVRAAQTLALDDRAFVAALGAHFGNRVRGFTTVGERRSFPLTLEFARTTTAPRAVVVGNAAQALHPVAGQGFNLGLRDAYELARIIVDTPRVAIGGRAMLERYAGARVRDRRAGIALTHGLVRLFGSEQALVRVPRGLGMTLLDAVPLAKRAFTRAMLFGLR